MQEINVMEYLPKIMEELPKGILVNAYILQVIKMIIENKIFERHTINKDKLISYGFEKVGNKLVYKTEILNGDFSVVIEYDGKIIGKIFDLAKKK